MTPCMPYPVNPGLVLLGDERHDQEGHEDDGQPDDGPPGLVAELDGLVQEPVGGLPIPGEAAVPPQVGPPGDRGFAGVSVFPRLPVDRGELARMAGPQIPASLCLSAGTGCVSTPAAAAR